MTWIRNIENRIEKLLTTVIDFFYPPFRKIMPLDLFRYGCCGGLNLALEWVLYYVFYHFVFQAKVFDWQSVRDPLRDKSDSSPSSPSQAPASNG